MPDLAKTEQMLRAREAIEYVETKLAIAKQMIVMDTGSKTDAAGVINVLGLAETRLNWAKVCADNEKRARMRKTSDSSEEPASP